MRRERIHTVLLSDIVDLDALGDARPAAGRERPRPTTDGKPVIGMLYRARRDGEETSGVNFRLRDVGVQLADAVLAGRAKYISLR